MLKSQIDWSAWQTILIEDILFRFNRFPSWISLNAFFWIDQISVNETSSEIIFVNIKRMTDKNTFVIEIRIVNILLPRNAIEWCVHQKRKRRDNLHYSVLIKARLTSDWVYWWLFKNNSRRKRERCDLFTGCGLNIWFQDSRIVSSRKECCHSIHRALIIGETNAESDKFRIRPKKLSESSSLWRVARRVKIIIFSISVPIIDGFGT